VIFICDQIKRLITLISYINNQLVLCFNSLLMWHWLQMSWKYLNCVRLFNNSCAGEARTSVTAGTGLRRGQESVAFLSSRGMNHSVALLLLVLVLMLVLLLLLLLRTLGGTVWSVEKIWIILQHHSYKTNIIYFSISYW